ncbi:MAG: (2Fe-2S)-binding protein [Clostridiales Family XIII bacterium]|jgi:NAD(P)H-nitrite reductase large subunit|nr:(2Fe-2S)-binding protein [Clostridiales Family XIII bacterium]
MQRTIRTRPTLPFSPEGDDGLIVCRCEEITKGEIRRAVYDGMRSMNEVKRYLRAGMGLCQGQTCQRLVQGILSRELGLPLGETGRIRGRVPARPVILEDFGMSDGDSEGV